MDVFFWQGTSGEKTVSKRIGAVSKVIQGSGVAWTGDRVVDEQA
jgi:hypothetical protein